MRTNKMRSISTAHLAAIVKESEIDPVILFGAGASATSGVPMAHDMANLAARWATAMHKGWHTSDPRIRESDVRIFLQSQTWFSANLTVEDYYQHSMRLLNSPRELRRRFLLHVLDSVSDPSGGYHQLARLVKQRVIRTLLTTNFDDRFRTAFGPGSLMTISEPSEHHRINTAPLHPQLIHLHGTADHYMDSIMEEEVQFLDPNLSSQVFPLLRDHPLIVVGYRGAEPSIMRSLFIDQTTDARKFPQGIFWCVLESSTKKPLPPMVEELARELGDNFALIPIAGFDQFMEEFSASVDQGIRAFTPETGTTNTITLDELAFDMRPADNARPSNLNRAILQHIVTEHSQRLGIPVPNSPDEDWYTSRLMSIGLLTKDADGAPKPTNAAVLLCAENGREFSAGHWVEISTPDRPPVAIDGSLVYIYDTVFERLEEANHPIRVKGVQSRPVQPYGSIALKELLANALIHRDYEKREPVKIWIDKDFIKIESPGGLDEALIRQMTGSSSVPAGEEFLNRIQRGEIGTRFTAYRNPNLAEVFWGLGYVDKVGSGLVDALRSLTEAGASATFEVTPNNDRFIATASISHLEIDTATRTALPRRPTMYWGNVVEFLAIPNTVHSARSKITHPRESATLTGARWIPPFALRNGKLFTFSDLTEPNSPFTAIADLGLVERQCLEEICQNSSTENIPAELLKKAIESRMSQSGMRVDRRRNRAYYRCDRQDARSIEYTNMAGRRTKRRVARWPVKLNVGHCEHDAVNYAIAQYGDSWALMLRPTFVVTLDGVSDQLPHNEHSSVVTRLQSEHYNRKVLSDVRFWLKQLETSNGVISIDLGGASVEISTRLVTFEGYSDSLEEQQDDYLTEG